MTLNQAIELYKSRSNEILKDRTALNYAKVRQYKYFKDILSKSYFIKVIKELNRRHGKRKRCWKKLEKIINWYYDIIEQNEKYQFEKKCYLLFGTCTFDNKAIEQKEETRTKKVNKWLKKHFILSIANIDYGDKTEREHHHFIGITFEDIKDTGRRSKKTGYKLYNLNQENDYQIGFAPDLEIVQLKDDLIDNKQLSNYLVKLNNHENKKSAINRRLREIKII